MSFYRSLLLTTIAAIGFASSVQAVNVPASQNPPKQLTPAQVPLFVVIGWDDNYYGRGMKWIVDYMKDKKNNTGTGNPATFDGTSARCSFYVNTNNSYHITDTNNNSDETGWMANGTPCNQTAPGATKWFVGQDAKILLAAWRKALADGHELGNHTAGHCWSDSATFVKSTADLALWNTGGSQPYWERYRWTTKQLFADMNNCRLDLQNVGIKLDTVGFRSPYLGYSDNTFKMLDSANGITSLGCHFLYDCSIESGLDKTFDGTNSYFPYTLDNGAAPADTIIDQALFIALNMENDKPVYVGKHPGKWEIPAQAVVIPPAIRHELWKKYTDNKLDFDTVNCKMTGLDYNMWIDPYGDNGQVPIGLTKSEYLQTLLYNLHQHLNGNHAPMIFGAHTPLYDSLTLPWDWNSWAENHSGATIPEMRQAMEAFIDSCLAIANVRVVTARQMLQWMQNPVALPTPIITSSTGAAATQLAMKLARGVLSLHAGFDAKTPVTIRLFSANGRRIAMTSLTMRDGTVSWKLPAIATGAYLVKAAIAEKSASALIFIQ